MDRGPYSRLGDSGDRGRQPTMSDDFLDEEGDWCEQGEGQSLAFQRLCGSCACNRAYNPVARPACAAWDCKGRSQESECKASDPRSLPSASCFGLSARRLGLLALERVVAGQAPFGLQDRAKLIPAAPMYVPLTPLTLGAEGARKRGTELT
jgi:hypothetical protein